MESKKSQEMFQQLIMKMIEGAASQEDIDSLQSILRHSSEARGLYLDFIEVHSGLNHIAGLLDTAGYQQEGANSPLDHSLWNALLQDEQTAPSVVFSEPDQPVERIQRVIYQKDSQAINKISLFVAMASCAAILLIVVFLKVAPKKQYSVEVATLVDQINTSWASSSFSLRNGERLLTNDAPYCLEKGVVEIQYDAGVEVLIEGPAQFRIETFGVFLDHGRLYSQVSETGRGFTVDTVHSRFVDLGTEFCVKAGTDGSSELHVLTGLVQLYAGLPGATKSSQTVSENNAVRFNANSGRIHPTSVETTAFIRKIDSKSNLVWSGQTLDLADIAGGGNGLGTGQFCYGVQFKEQTIAPGIPAQPIDDNDRRELLGWKPIKQSAFIDGVFSPVVIDQAPLVSSEGHRFDECPETSGYNPGVILNLFCTSSRLLQTKNQLAEFSHEKQFPALNVHSNQGITFDLDAIRSTMPGLKLTKLTTRCKTSKHAIHDEQISREIQELVALMDHYILVDGQVKVARKDVSINSHLPVDVVPIAPTDKFLSLVVTEGSDRQTVKDWGYFEAPRLHFEKE